MSRAVTLAELADQAVFTVNGNTNFVGIGSTVPVVKLDVGGNAAVSGTTTSLNLNVTGGANITGVVTASSFSGNSTGLTGTPSIAVADITGIGANLTGVVTASSFSGTVPTATNATGLTGTPDITVRNIVGAAATFSGVLTYEDVTNVDSLGIVTARNGLRVTQGGINVTAGISTFGGNITSSGSITDDKGDLRTIPASTKSSGYVLVAADTGKVIYISTGGVTINNSVHSGGDVISIINNSGSDQTITQGSGLTLYNTADASTGTKTLAGRGMATVWFASASIAYISGSGLS